MPRIKRWAPISHDFNRDPQVIQLRKDFGDWAALAWQEILFIADRNDGIVVGTVDQIARILAPVSLQMYQGRAANAARTILERFKDNSWITIEQDCIRVVKWLNYHRIREHNQVPSEPDHTKPDLIKNKKKIIHPISDEPKNWPNPILLIAKYNAETPDCLPAIEKATPARLRKARDYLKIFPDESFWTETFQEIAKSDFLLGLRGNNGHESFKANFDWLLTKGKDGTENVVKVFEGRYRNGTNQGFKQYR